MWASGSTMADATAINAKPPRARAALRSKRPSSERQRPFHTCLKTTTLARQATAWPMAAATSAPYSPACTTSVTATTTLSRLPATLATTKAPTAFSPASAANSSPLSAMPSSPSASQAITPASVGSPSNQPASGPPNSSSTAAAAAAPIRPNVAAVRHTANW